MKDPDTIEEEIESVEERIEWSYGADQSHLIGYRNALQWVLESDDDDPVAFKSDGVELTLADGRVVAPVLSFDAERCLATAIDPDNGYAYYGIDSDDSRIKLQFEMVDNNE